MRHNRTSMIKIINYFVFLWIKIHQNYQNSIIHNTLSEIYTKNRQKSKCKIRKINLKGRKNQAMAWFNWGKFNLLCLVLQIIILQGKFKKIKTRKMSKRKIVFYRKKRSNQESPLLKLQLNIIHKSYKLKSFYKHQKKNSHKKKYNQSKRQKKE